MKNNFVYQLSPGLCTKSREVEGKHEPLIAFDRIRANDDDPYEALSIHFHETVHANQFAQTSYGLFTLWSSTEQGRLISTAYRTLHPIAVKHCPHDFFMPIDNFSSFHNSGCKHLKKWKTIELLRSLLDGQTDPPPPLDGSIQAFKSIINNYELDMHDILPTSTWDIGKNDVFSIAGKNFLLRYLLPGGTPYQPFGAYGLMESSAVAAQLACWTLFPTKLQCTSRIYHTGQDLFLRVIGTLDRIFQCIGFQESFNKQLKTFYNNAPLQNLFDLVFVNIKKVSPHSLQVHLLETVTQICVLFCSIVELALNTPIGPIFHGLNKQITWHDLHPGWRYVRAISIMHQFLTVEPNKIFDWLANPTILEDQITDILGWPSREEMIKCISDWRRSSLPIMVKSYTNTDINRLSTRSLHTILGQAHTCSWIPFIFFIKSENGKYVQEGIERRDNTIASWPTEHQDALKYDQSVTIDFLTGKCLWEVHHNIEDFKKLGAIVNHEEYRRKLFRPLSLSEAVLTEFFHLHILRMLYFGSANCPPYYNLLKAICSNQCASYKDVEEACKLLVHHVWEYQIYR